MSDAGAPPPPFGLFQTEIYGAGLGGVVPELPFAYEEWERRAREVLTPEAYTYIAGGAGRGDTMRVNREAFERMRIVPRMAREVEARDWRTSVLGTAMPAPLMLAPVGGQSMCHPEGDLATARAAAALGVPMILSSVSSRSIEEVAEAMGDAPRWFQLYWPRDPEVAASFVSRAEAAGYGAIVVTLDTPAKAWAPGDLAGAYVPMLRGDGLANYLSDPVVRAALPVAPEEDRNHAIGWFAMNFMNPAVTWDLLGTLREHTALDLRGIRSLRVIPQAGGIDVARAIGLGASAALVGRPFVWALAVAGEDGVRHLLRSLLAEFDMTLALSGVTTLDELSDDTFATT